MFTISDLNAPKRFPRVLTSIFAVLAIIIIMLGAYYYLHERESLFEDAQRDLSVVADLKVKQITDWRRERMSDAMFIYSNPNIAFVFKQVLDGHSKELHSQQTVSWMTAMFQNRHYRRILFFDAQKKLRFAVPESINKESRFFDSLFSSAISQKQIIFSDFFLNAERQIELNIFVPVLDLTDSAKPVLGIIILEINPSSYFYSLIQSWPTISQTAECVLFRRDGNDILYLNELRHQQNTALTLRFPLTRTSLSAVQALSGREGFLEGYDYRNHNVLAVSKQVPASPWFLITKIDKDELLESLNFELYLIIVLIGSIVLLGIVTLALVSHFQRAKFYKTLYQSESEKLALAQHYELMTKYANDSIFLFDTDLRIIEVNEQASLLYGYSKDEFLHLTLYTISAQESLQVVETAIVTVKEQSSLRYETVHRAKDGLTFPVEISARLITIENTSYYHCIIRDITQRNASEQKIKKLNRLYATLSEINQTIVRVQSKEALFQKLCTIAVEHGKFRMAWIGVLDEKKKAITPIASSGITGEYLNALFISQEDIAHGRGPTGIAAREKRYAICNDILNDPRMLPWRDAAKQIGYASSAAIPIIIHHNVVAILNVYTEEKNFFDFDEIRLLEEIGYDIAFALEQYDAAQEHLRSEIARKESEERLRLALEAGNQGIYDLNVVTGEATTNLEYATMLGYDPTTFKETNQLWIERLHPDDKESVEEAFRAYAAGKLSEYKIEFRQRTATGEWKWILSLGKIIEYDSAGKPLRMLGTHTDITRRKLAEIALRASEEKFKELFNSAPIGYHELDTEGTITNINDTELTMLGYTREEMVGHQIWEFIADQELSRERVLAKLSGTIQNDQRSERTYIRKNGTTVPVLSDERLLRNEQGIVIGLRTVIQDISEQKQIETELMRVRVAVESSGEIIFLTDKEGIFTYVNPAFTRIYGYTFDEVVGKVTPRIIKSNQVPLPEYEQFWESILSKRQAKREFINKSKSGKLFTVEAAVSPIIDKDGTIGGFLAIQRDITEKKLFEEQYYRAQRLESLGTLAGGIAHDLNNVLTPIIMGAEIIKTRIANEHDVQILKTIEQSAERGKGIVRQILTFARGSQGERGIIQPKHIIREMEKMIKETFPKSIEFTCSIDKSLFAISGDATQLHQVLLNLCVNARDAMPNGGNLSIIAKNQYLDEQTAALHHDAKIGWYTVITVKDSGMGMTKEVQSKIFEPFFTTKERGKGTGLGLATVYSLVKSHEGFIRVESETGKGSAFMIYLPAIEQAEAMLETLKHENIPSGNGEHILIVDDEASIRDITKQTLEMFGYNIFQASDGTEAIAMYAKHQALIKLVMTDIMMPVMDGYATIRALKKINPNLRIIAASGILGDIDIVEATSGKIEGFIHKPFTPSVLLETIHGVLSQHQEQQAVTNT